MPLDRRLREGLRREAATFTPDVERNLAKVAARGRPAPARGLALVATAVILLVVAIRIGGGDPLAMVAGVLSPDRSLKPSASSASTADDRLAGTYRVTLDGGDVTVVSLTMGGEWIVSLRTDSGIELTAPTTFAADDPAALTGYIYATRGDLFYTNAFAHHFSQGCAGSGTYRWSMVAGGLHFELVEDSCPARVALMTGSDWTSSPA